jgi:hypothetical protein
MKQTATSYYFGSLTVVSPPICSAGIGPARSIEKILMKSMKKHIPVKVRILGPRAGKKKLLENPIFQMFSVPS